MAVQNTSTVLDTEAEIPADLTTFMQDLRLSDGYRAMVKMAGISHGIWFLDKEDNTTVVNGQTVVATMSGVGRWKILVVGGGGGGSVGLSDYAMFFGTTSGTGSTQNDYAATVATGAALPFPQNGPTAALGITRNGADAGRFLLALGGTYEVSWAVCTTEPAEWQLRVNGALVANTTARDSNPTSGGHPVSNTVLITVQAGALLEVVNPPGDAAALTITPADGSLTHAQAPSLVITKIG